MNNEQERYQANIDLLRKQAIESGLVKVEKIEQMRTDKSFGIEVDKHELSNLVLETIKILEPFVKDEGHEVSNKPMKMPPKKIITSCGMLRGMHKQANEINARRSGNQCSSSAPEEE